MNSQDNFNRLLIVEDDPGLQKQLKWCFSEHEVLAATNREQALAHVRRYTPPVVLQDLGLPPDPNGVSEGIATLKEILAFAPQTKVIVVTGHHDKENALRAVAAGAYDFYQKPVDTDVLKLLVGRAFNLHALEEQNRQLELANAESADGIIATDDAMRNVCRMIDKVAPADVTVLITGESGTGKELVARALHTKSEHASGRFVAINCAAIPEQLLEAELFGYEKGAFTGAVKQTPGKIELADGGTLFLDEIGDMPLPLQAKLLRFLQSRMIERVGGRVELPIKTRVLCATHRDLETMIAAQIFRQDLFFRISEIRIQIPALRERSGAPTVLAHHLLHRFAGLRGQGRRGFTEDASAALESYSWPGNVRELENKLKSALIMADGPLITAKDLGLTVSGEGLMLNLRKVRSRAERQAVNHALVIVENNISMAAELLGVTRPTLYDLMNKLGIKVASVRDE